MKAFLKLRILAKATVLPCSKVQRALFLFVLGVEYCPKLQHALYGTQHAFLTGVMQGGGAKVISLIQQLAKFLKQNDEIGVFKDISLLLVKDINLLNHKITSKQQINDVLIN